MSNLAHKYEDERRKELLGGKIYTVDSRSICHFRVVRNIFIVLDKYLASKKCKVFFGSVDVYLTNDDIVIPDITVVCDESKITHSKIVGAPDLVAEVLSPSTHERDYGYKKSLYEKHGVKEYWIVDPEYLFVETYQLICINEVFAD